MFPAKLHASEAGATAETAERAERSFQEERNQQLCELCVLRRFPVVTSLLPRSERWVEKAIAL